MIRIKVAETMTCGSMSRHLIHKYPVSFFFQSSASQVDNSSVQTINFLYHISMDSLSSFSSAVLFST